MEGSDYMDISLTCGTLIIRCRFIISGFMARHNKKHIIIIETGTGITLGEAIEKVEAASRFSGDNVFWKIRFET